MFVDGSKQSHDFSFNLLCRDTVDVRVCHIQFSRRIFSWMPGIEVSYVVKLDLRKAHITPPHSHKLVTEDNLHKIAYDLLCEFIEKRMSYRRHCWYRRNSIVKPQ